MHENSHEDVQTGGGWQRQAFQSFVQFLAVFFTGMVAYDKTPTSLDQLWQPAVQGVLAALIIWGGSKVPLGGRR